MRGLSPKAPGGALAALVAMAACLALPAEARADWVTWGNGAMRQGVATESQLTSHNAKRLRMAWPRPIGGVGAAQPLSISGQAVPGGRIYLVASESGRVTAFVALNGAVLWTRELGFVNTACSELPHGQFGITGTPTY